MKTVRIVVEGGVIQYVDCPRGVRVVVKDYDTDSVEDNLQYDEQGDAYIEGVWEHSNANV